MIIGFGCSARVGKSTACDYLVKFYGFTSLAFADPLKEAVKIIYGLSEEQVNGRLKNIVDEFWNETPRQILQRVGTDSIRKGHRGDVWVKSMERRLLKNPENNWAISDIRFPDEANMIKYLGGYVIKINGTFSEKQEIISSNHESEIAMKSYEEWNAVIDNNGSLKDFYKKLDNLYENLVKNV